MKVNNHSVLSLMFSILFLLASSGAWAAKAGLSMGATPSDSVKKMNVPKLPASPCPKYMKLVPKPEGAFECKPDYGKFKCPKGYKFQYKGCGFECYVDVKPPK